MLLTFGCTMKHKPGFADSVNFVWPREQFRTTEDVGLAVAVFGSPHKLK